MAGLLSRKYPPTVAGMTPCDKIAAMAIKSVSALVIDGLAIF